MAAAVSANSAARARNSTRIVTMSRINLQARLAVGIARSSPFWRINVRSKIVALIRKRCQEQQTCAMAVELPSTGKAFASTYPPQTGQQNPFMACYHFSNAEESHDLPVAR